MNEINASSQENENNKWKRIYIISFLWFFIVSLIVFIFLIFNNSRDKVNQEKQAINTSINSWSYDEVIDFYEKKWTWNLDNGEKISLSISYLNKGTFSYNEKEYSEKALAVLSNMDNTYDVLYYKWYANEIIKNYTWALENYNQWLNLNGIWKEEKSYLMNQIWHLYDLMWDTEKAFKYYNDSYELNNNATSLINLWRYYIRKGDIEKWHEYMERSIDSKISLPAKAETYFWLSTTELELNWLNPDIDKSIDYAQKWIEVYSQYPMNYIALARGYYLKNDGNNDLIEKNLDKAISINPNLSYAYELYAMYEFDRWNYEKFVEYIKEADSVVDNDMILMDSQRESTRLAVNFRYYIFTEIHKNKKDVRYIINFLDEKVLQSDLWKSIIKNQLIRKDYGVLFFLKNNNKFLSLVKNIK